MWALLTQYLWSLEKGLSKASFNSPCTSTPRTSFPKPRNSDLTCEACKNLYSSMTHTFQHTNVFLAWLLLHQTTGHPQCGQPHLSSSCSDTYKGTLYTSTHVARPPNKTAVRTSLSKFCQMFTNHLLTLRIFEKDLHFIKRKISFNNNYFAGKKINYFPRLMELFTVAVTPQLCCQSLVPVFLD